MSDGVPATATIFTERGSKMCAPLKRYLLFSGSFYYPAGGWEDFDSSFDSEDEAKATGAKSTNDYSWWHVVDCETGRLSTKDDGRQLTLMRTIAHIPGKKSGNRKMHIVSKLFSNGTMTARVLIDGEYYDVREHELALLQGGRTVADLDLCVAQDGPREFDEEEWHRLRRIRAL